MDEFGSATIIAADETHNDPATIEHKTASVSCLQDSGGYLMPNSSANDELTESNSTHQTKACQSISTGDLISWSFQIARGMGYLSSKKVLP